MSLPLVLKVLVLAAAGSCGTSKPPTRNPVSAVPRHTLGVYLVCRDKPIYCGPWDPPQQIQVGLDHPLPLALQNLARTIEGIVMRAGVDVATLDRVRTPCWRTNAPALGLWRTNDTTNVPAFCPTDAAIRLNTRWLMQVSACVTRGDNTSPSSGVADHPYESAVVAFLLAHEYGHYLDFLSGRKLSRNERFRHSFEKQVASGRGVPNDTDPLWMEAWADYFAGYALREMQPNWVYQFVERLCAVRLVKTAGATTAHPEGEARAELLSAGTRNFRQVRQMLRDAFAVSATSGPSSPTCP